MFEDKANPLRRHLISSKPAAGGGGGSPRRGPPSTFSSDTPAPRTVIGARGAERIVSAILAKIEAREKVRKAYLASAAQAIAAASSSPDSSREPAFEEPPSAAASAVTTTTLPAQLRSPAHAITVLDLTKQCIGDDGAVAVGALIARDTQITTICLSGNYISQRGVTALADGIRRNCGSLQKLTIIDNDINNEAAVALFKAIKDLRLRLIETSVKNSNINNNGRVGIQSLEVGFNSPETLFAVMSAQQANMKPKTSASSGAVTPRQQPSSSEVSFAMQASSKQLQMNNGNPFDHSRMHLSDDACIALSEACFCSADGIGAFSGHQCLPFALKALKIVNSPLSFTASSLGALIRGASSAVWASPDEQPANGQYHVTWSYTSANRGLSLSPRDGPLCELSLVNCVDFGPLRTNENGILSFTKPFCQSVLSPPLAFQQHALLSRGGLRQLELHHLPLGDIGVQDIFSALISNERTRQRNLAAQQKLAPAAPSSKGAASYAAPPSPSSNPAGANPGLTTISLCKSRFHLPLSILTIADFIALNPPLRRLDLSNCYSTPRKLIPADGDPDQMMIPLWNALTSNTTLQSIDVTGFPIGFEDLKTLIDIFVQGLNSTVVSIEYTSSSVSTPVSGSAGRAISGTIGDSDTARGTLLSCLLANANAANRNQFQRRVFLQQQEELGGSAPASVSSKGTSYDTTSRRRSLSRGLNSR